MAVNVEESMYETTNPSLDLNTPASFDEPEMSYVGLDSQNSPIEGSSSSGEPDDVFVKPADPQVGGIVGLHAGAAHVAPQKPTGTNNFVTKLYQYVHLCVFVYVLTRVFCRMINDPKSSTFITWTELGTRCATPFFSFYGSTSAHAQKKTC